MRQWRIVSRVPLYLITKQNPSQIWNVNRSCLRLIIFVLFPGEDCPELESGVLPKPSPDGRRVQLYVRACRAFAEPARLHSLRLTSTGNPNPYVAASQKEVDLISVFVADLLPPRQLRCCTGRAISDRLALPLGRASPLTAEVALAPPPPSSARLWRAGGR